jgi:hypothetical protein
VARRTRFAILTAGLALAVLVAAVIYKVSRIEEVAFVTGAVLSDDSELHKQRPIENVVITVSSEAASGQATSDASGFFRLHLHPAVEVGHPMRFTFRHPDYRSIETTRSAKDQIHVVRMTPESPEAVSRVEQPSVAISNVRVRYGLKTATTVPIGSAAKTFDIVNTGIVPCNDRPPCSPDGKWKAAVDSLSLDAGADKKFRNVRVSCIAGPCPFTAIESDEFSEGGQGIGVSVRNWSDTVTYLLEAEVVQTMTVDMVRRSYPFIFGRSMHFTLPATAQGPSIETEVDGSEIVFPLGPSLILSWADCSLEIGSDGTKQYRCDLKPEYRFGSEPAL